MATVLAFDVSTSSHPLARAAGKLAIVASSGAAAIAEGLDPDAAIKPAHSRVRQAFETWIAARLHFETAPSSESDDDPLHKTVIDTERALAREAAATAEDMLFKLLPLALHEHQPLENRGGPFALQWEPQNPENPFVEEETWRGLLDGLVELCPRVAELVAMPRIGASPIAPVALDGNSVARPTGLIGLLADRQRAFAAVEQSSEDDARQQACSGELIRIEDGIFEADATTKDDLLAKSLLAVRLLSEGHSVAPERASAILAEAAQVGIPTGAEA